MHSLARLRLRLTAWYVGVFLSILALLGGGLFLAIRHRMSQQLDASLRAAASALMQAARIREAELVGAGRLQDRKSTRLNSSHDQISYAVFCLKKKKKESGPRTDARP